MKRVLKIVGIVIAVILVVVIVLPFFVDVNSFGPTLESNLSTALGRQVKVGNLSLSLFSGTVSAEDLAIADDPAFSQAPFVKAKSLKVGVEIMPLIFSKTLHVTELTLDRPEITLLHAASGKWNFSSLGGGSKSNAPSSGTTGSGTGGSTGGTSLTVNKLSVDDGRLSVGKANSSAKPQTYDQVNITVRDFSFTSQFPFTLSAKLPGGGDLKLDGKAGPINNSDASLTPVSAQVAVKHLDLAASGFVDPSSGIAGLADFDGKLDSDGKQLHTSGTLTADKLKLAAKGSPAGRPVQLKYALEHDLHTQGGKLTQGDISMGKALAQLTGTYQTQGESALLNMKLNGQGMPVDELQAMLPALGVILPSGSSLKGGTLSTALAITGPVDKLVITGPLRLADTRLAGFNLASKMSAISALTGSQQSGSDTSIQNLSTDARVAPDGIRTENVNLTVPTLGVVTGNGTISPGGALNYKMNATLSGGAVGGLTQMAGMGKGGSVPFFIQGTTSDPKFVPDVQGMVGSQLKSRMGANSQAGSAVDALTGLFGKKKKTK
ncbi:MAG: AsmA family protein [Acidobacteriia bacterium]|nr:AsmA family protein [Terriglobia bacterium]